jgi:hypothetical protein
MTAARTQTLKLIGAALLLAAAGMIWFRWGGGAGSGTDRTWFYDLSEGRLFTAPRSAIPPIRGLNDAQEDAVRAVVISTNGNPRDRSARTIAYLETYSPELKRQMETARAAGEAPVMGRGMAQAHRFVRRLQDRQWYPLTSPEAERIVSEWLTAGPNGGPAVICPP